MTVYTATCRNCPTPVRMLFFDRGERDGWANRHIDATGHEILIEQGEQRHPEGCESDFVRFPVTSRPLSVDEVETLTVRRNTV